VFLASSNAPETGYESVLRPLQGEWQRGATPLTMHEIKKVAINSSNLLHINISSAYPFAVSVRAEADTTGGVAPLELGSALQVHLNEIDKVTIELKTFASSSSMEANASGDRYGNESPFLPSAASVASSLGAYHYQSEDSNSEPLPPPLVRSALIKFSSSAECESFLQSFSQMGALQASSTGTHRHSESESETSLQLCLSCVVTKTDASLPRSGLIRAVAVVGALPVVRVLRRLLQAAAFASVGELNLQPSILSDLWQALTHLPLVTNPTSSSPMVEGCSAVDTHIMLRSLVHSQPLTQRSELHLSSLYFQAASKQKQQQQQQQQQQQHSSPDHGGGFAVYNGVVNFLETTFPVAFSLSLEGTLHFATELSALIQLLGPSLMHVYNAMFTGHRILVLGENRPVSYLTAAIFSLVGMLAPPLTGLLERRTFPYATLGNLDFLEVPGFIAGVKNPIFAQHDAWWDVLVDLNAGKVVLHPLLKGDVRIEASKREDTAFFAQLKQTVLEKKGSEDYVRLLFQDYTRQLMDSALWPEYYPASPSMLEENLPRIRGWKQTECGQDTIRLRGSFFQELRQLSLDETQVARWMVLATQRKLHSNECQLLFAWLAELNEQQLRAMLSLLPFTYGGLQPLATALFHANPPVLNHATTFFEHLEKSPWTSPYLEGLNTFFRTALTRNTNRHCENESVRAGG
jgi:hypothetical protein